MIIAEDTLSAATHCLSSSEKIYVHSYLLPCSQISGEQLLPFSPLKLTERSPAFSGGPDKKKGVVAVLLSLRRTLTYLLLHPVADISSPTVRAVCYIVLCEHSCRDRLSTHCDWTAPSNTVTDCQPTANPHYNTKYVIYYIIITNINFYIK
jgi:hypothetical protein